MLTPALLSLAVLAVAVGSAGRGPVQCDPGSQFCYVDVTDPGAPGSTPPPSGRAAGAGGGQRVCVISRTGEPTPCHDDAWGWFNGEDDCYYTIVDPQPPASDPVWQGHHPEGAIYLATCMWNIPGTNGGWTWRPTPPAGFQLQISPAELAQRALDQMGLAAPAIGTTVPPGREGLVGVPVWLWTEVSPTTWGPISATASVPGLSVTATATVTSIAWDMGDGQTEVCANPGTPWFDGAVDSPTCDHVYARPSAGQPNDAYTVTATSTWQVTWSGGGASGELTVTRSSSTTVRIGELQVLTTT